jgi:hypothetical protein
MPEFPKDEMPDTHALLVVNMVLPSATNTSINTRADNVVHKSRLSLPVAVGVVATTGGRFVSEIGGVTIEAVDSESAAGG